MQLEASDEVASWYGRQAILRNKFIDPQELEQRLRALSATDLRRAAVMIMKNQGLNLALIGPIKAGEQARLRRLLKL